MIKKLLYKWLFEEEKENMEKKYDLMIENRDYFEKKFNEYYETTLRLQEKVNQSFDINDILQSLNKSISFNKIDNDGKPPHYLAGMGAESRANAISKLSFIYEEPMFQQVFEYMIDVMGNKCFFVATEENMKNYRHAVLGIQAVMKEFEDAHNEFINSTKKTESFDPLEIFPEE